MLENVCNNEIELQTTIYLLSVIRTETQREKQRRRSAESEEERWGEEKVVVIMCVIFVKDD